MRRSWLLALLVFLPALAGILLVVPQVSSERTSLRHEEGIGFVLPSPLYRVVALEFKGILADVIFSRAMTWYGGKVMRDEKLNAEEWDWIYANMDVATDLDPYFYDPYLFGAVNLAWEAGRPEEANALLEKALGRRDWDWSIPFYLGFNYFYFLQDNASAAAYLMQAAERPGGSGVLAQLATRLLHQERNTENAVIFLREIIRKTEEGQTRDIYLIRLAALEGILLLERAVSTFAERHGRKPAALEELVETGIIRALPRDPYGGHFYLDADGAIKTTSELRFGKPDGSKS